MERINAGILVLSHPPCSSSQCTQADSSGSSLKGNNSPDLGRDSSLALWCLSMTAECRVTILTTKGVSHRQYILGIAGVKWTRDAREETGDAWALGRELKD